MEKLELDAQVNEFKDEKGIIQFKHEFLKLLKKIEENTRKP